MVAFNIKNIDWQKIQHPSPTFKLFEPSVEKLATIFKHLMDGYLNVSDEFRIPSILNKLMQSYFLNPNNLIYEGGNNQALVGFISIVPTFKAELIFKLFDKTIWGVDFAREGKELLDFIMDSFALERINTSSPDIKVVKMSKIFGFKIEGKREKDFMFNNKSYDSYLMGLRRK